MRLLLDQDVYASTLPVHGAAQHGIKPTAPSARAGGGETRFGACLLAKWLSPFSPSMTRTAPPFRHEHNLPAHAHRADLAARVVYLDVQRAGAVDLPALFAEDVGARLGDRHRPAKC